MDEKKLTDEEVLTAIEKCFAFPMKCEDGCPYFNKNGRNFCVENKAFYKDLKRIVTEHADQKAEIERLNRQVELNEERIVREMNIGYANERQAVKDTAKEILQDLYDVIKYETFRKGYELKKISRKIKEVANSRGVEVTENE